MLDLNYNTKRMAVALILMVVILEVMMASLFLQPEADGLRKMVLSFTAIMLGCITPALYHFELPKSDQPKYKLSQEDVLLAVIGRSVLLGLMGLALVGFGPIGQILVLGAQLLLTVYSVYLIVWKLK